MKQEAHKTDLVCSVLFICDSISSVCPLCNATSIAWGPTHPSPFSVSSGSQSNNVGIFTEVEDGGQRRDGILHHAESYPWQSSVCTTNSTESDSMYAQVLSGQSQIHPELSKALDEWLELAVFRQKQIHLLSFTITSCTNHNGTTKRKYKHCSVWPLRNLGLCWIDPEV